MGSKAEYHGDGTATVWVDIDPVKGDDKNSGRKGEGPVKTLARAKQLLSGLPSVDLTISNW